MRQIGLEIALFTACQLFTTFALGLENKGSFYSPAKDLAKEVGTVNENETVELAHQKTPIGWKTIYNKFFIISHPECFGAEGQGGEGNLKKTGVILLTRSTRCEYFDKDPNSPNWLSISIDFGGYTKPSNATRDNTLLRQKYKINGLDALLLISAENDIGIAGSKVEPQLRTELRTICGEYNFTMVYYSPKGLTSIELARAKKFNIPEDFNQIMSSFQCAKDNKRSKR